MKKIVKIVKSGTLWEEPLNIITGQRKRLIAYGRFIKALKAKNAKE